jgi:hypothetical protein
MFSRIKEEGRMSGPILLVNVIELISNTDAVCNSRGIREVPNHGDSESDTQQREQAVFSYLEVFQI